MRHLGRYEICGLLGRGGMSLVYKVRLPVIEKIMALKLHHPHPILINLWGEEALRKRFIQEAVLMARLRHPNLLAIWDFDESAGTPFLVTEYYCYNLGTLIGESGELERPTRRLRPDRIFHYGRQMLKGLDRLHQAGIVHRDIKPFNLLITDGEAIKIGDFGLSLLRGEPHPGPDNLKVGSPYYAAPEQEQDPDRVDGRADLYSVGVTLYRLATGLLPSEAGQPPSRPFPEWDSEWDTFLSKAIAFDKQDRYRTAGEMLRALEQLCGHWETRPKTDCPAVPVPAATARVNGPANPLRRNPTKLPPAEAPAFFQVDALWRPRSFFAPAWKVHPDGTVADLSHGLQWEQSGSEYPLTWPEAGLYVQDLNRKRFAGRTDWRLPTVEELCSLITEVPGGHAYCLALPFATAQKFLWSADRRSFNAAWFVSIDLGFVFWQDFTCHYHARAVCSD